MIILLNVLLMISLICLLSIYLPFFKDKKENIYLKLISFISYLFYFLINIILLKRLPLFNFYDTIILLILILYVKNLINKELNDYFYIPIIIFQLILVFIPQGMIYRKVLQGVLNSIYIFIHVPFFIAGYASIIYGFILTIFRMKEKIVEKEMNLAYFLITIGLVIGSLWGEQSWGNVWTWDPKECWALILWLVLTLYFHIKRKYVKEILVIITFLILIWTYVGVMFVIPGLHSYR